MGVALIQHEDGSYIKGLRGPAERAHDARSRDDLIRGGLPLLIAIVRRNCGRGARRDDLLSAGYDALVSAAETSHSESHPVCASRAAAWMQEACSSVVGTRLPHVPRKRTHRRVHLAIRDALAAVTPLEKSVLELRLGVDSEEISLRQVSERMGISLGRAELIETCGFRSFGIRLLHFLGQEGAS
jgi:DNA-directed RNA polymerase specialized sigma subunit